MKTIFALTTGHIKAGVAVIRVSGDNAVDVYKNLTGKKELEPRKAVFSSFYNPKTKEILDKGIAIYFKSPASFTGEDIVEFHVHGGKAVVDGFISVLSEQKDCRMAEPGEFTRRAFENGKLDLTEAEAIADLVDAETEAQKMQALDQLGGSLSQLYQGWADTLKKLLAHQEADIEFPDDDMPEGIAEGLKPELEDLLKNIKIHLNDKRRGERLRNGVLIAILGAPNAGKSSLLNALAERDVAIVSEEAGTTRDIIEVHLDLGGYPVILADTAGLRETTNKIEAEGIRRAEKLSNDADLKIALFDSTLNTVDKETEKMIDENTIVVLTKSDCHSDRADNASGGILRSLDYARDDNNRNIISISSTTGEGVEEFLKVLTKKISQQFAKQDQPSLTRERHRLALQDTKQALERSLAVDLPELAAEDLRLALRSLGSITGRVHVEELLDKIFKDFCIGK